MIIDFIVFIVLSLYSFIALHTTGNRIKVIVSFQESPSSRCLPSSTCGPTPRMSAGGLTSATKSFQAIGL